MITRDSSSKRSPAGAGLYAAVAIAVAVFLIAGAFSSAEAQKGRKGMMKYHRQKVCPVMGGEIDSTLYVDMQGQRVYFCCESCIGKFREDPDKYFEKAAEDSVIFENVQKVCPVSGEPIKEKDPGMFMYYRGRGLYFCCEGCMEKFRKDPEMYLKRMRHMKGGMMDERGMKKGHMKGGKMHEHQGGGDTAAEGGCGAPAKSCEGKSAGCSRTLDATAGKRDKK